MTVPSLWFRAFDRATADQLLDALENGDTPSPNPSSTTKLNEQVLQIAPPHVYAYLAALNPSFGKNAVALNENVCSSGTVTPFDTGGAVGHIQPLATMKPAQRCAILKACSWPGSAFASKRKQWPGTSDVSWDDYVRLQMPPGGGPHTPFKLGAQVPIWHAKNQWQAWIWELRVPGVMPFGAAIRRWTCTTELMAAMRARARSDAAFLTRLAPLLPRYIDGGSSVLLESLRGAA